MSPSSFTSKPYRKHFVIFLLLISCVCATPATAQSWLWARTAISGAGSGDGGSGAGGTATDLSGNVFVTGDFGSDSIIVGTIKLYNTGIYNMLLVKYDSSGNVLWAKSSGGGAGSANESGNSLATDVLGNVYVTGYFSCPSITFDSITLTNYGATNIFLVKYDADGNVKWAISGKGTGDDWASKTTTDASGNVYISGWFSSRVLTINTTTLNSVDGSADNMLIVKLDSSGNVLWANSTGINGGSVEATSVTTDTWHNVYVSGNFINGYVTFGTTTFTSGNIYLVKYNATGNIVWAESAGTSTNSTMFPSNILSIANDAAGNIYETGFFTENTITFGAYTLTNFSSSGSEDMFLVKYDSSGNILWAQTLLGSSLGWSVTTDLIGSIYLLGEFFSDSINIGATALSSSKSDLLLVKYNPAGNVEWVKSADGGGEDCDPASVATDVAGNVYVAGAFGLYTLTLGDDTLINSDTTAPMYPYDMFLAKLSSTLSTPIINPNQRNMVLYPNPNNGALTLVFPEKGYNSIQVYDCLGRQVYTASLTGREKSINIDMGCTPPGVYYLKATGEGKSESMPFVVR